MNWHPRGKSPGVEGSTIGKKKILQLSLGDDNAGVGDHEGHGKRMREIGFTGGKKKAANRDKKISPVGGGKLVPSIEGL